MRSGFKEKRSFKNSKSSLQRFMSDDVDKLQAVYDETGRDYAIVGYPHRRFLPLVPRHMTNKNWRDLFWANTQLLVIGGRRYPDLCSICNKALVCLSRGKGTSHDFDCDVVVDDLHVPLTSRSKGDHACPR